MLCGQADPNRWNRAASAQRTHGLTTVTSDQLSGVPVGGARVLLVAASPTVMTNRACLSAADWSGRG